MQTEWQEIWQEVFSGTSQALMKKKIEMVSFIQAKCFYYGGNFDVSQ